MEELASMLSSVEAFFESFGGLISWLLIALPLILVLCVLMPIFMVRGFKKGTFHGLVSLGCSLLSFALSLLLSKLIGSLIASLTFGSISGVIKGLVDSVLPQFSDIVMGSTYLNAFIQGVFSALVSTLLFVILFIILLIVSKIVVCRLLKKKIIKEKAGAGFKTGGLLIRGVDAFLIAMLLLAPIYCLLGSGAQLGEDAAQTISAHSDEQQAEDELSAPDLLADALLTVCKPISDAPVVKISLLPGFDYSRSVFCSFRCEGSSYNIYGILSDGSHILAQGLSFIEKKPAEYSEEEVQLLNDLVTTAEKNDFFYGVFLDGMKAADELITILLPEGEGNDDDLVQNMIFALIEPFKNCTIKDIKTSALTISAIFESAIENDILKNFDNSALLFESAATTPFIDETVTELRADPLLSGSVDSLLLICLEFVDFTSENGESDGFSQSIASLKETVEKNIQKGAPDPQKEIASLKKMAEGLAKLNDSAKGSDFESISTSGIAQLLMGLGMHPHIGSEGAKQLLDATLPSFKDSGNGSILTDDFISAATNALVYDIEHADELAGKQGKFENLLNTAQNLAVVVSKGTGTATEDKETLNKTVDMLLTDMTPESAQIVTDAITQDVMDSMNNNGNAASAEGFVKDLIGNMAEYDGASQEEVAKEREAVIKMNDLVLDAENKLNNKTDDKTAIETAVGGDLEGFVRDVSGSVVLMETVNDSFERNPDKATDPDGLFGNMGEDDKNKLNEVCGELLLDEELSAEQKENVKKLCSFMGGSLN